MKCRCDRMAVCGDKCFECMEAQLRMNASNIKPALRRSDDDADAPISNAVIASCSSPGPIERCPDCGCAAVEWVCSHDQCGGCGRVLASCCEGAAQ